MTNDFSIMTYTVKRGDTHSGISQEYSVPIKEIQSLNGIPDPNKIKEGQILKMKRLDSDSYTADGAADKNISNLEVLPVSLPEIEPPVIDYDDFEKSKKVEQAKKELADFTKSLLNADFYETSVIKKDTENGEQYFLRIKRAETDKNRLNTFSSNKLTMEYIRKMLGVKEGVIQSNNNSKDVADRKNNFPEYATITIGRHLDIPVSELGQESGSWKSFRIWYCTQSNCEKLKSIAKELTN